MCVCVCVCVCVRARARVCVRVSVSKKKKVPEHKKTQMLIQTQIPIHVQRTSKARDDGEGGGVEEGGKREGKHSLVNQTLN